MLNNIIELFTGATQIQCVLPEDGLNCKLCSLLKPYTEEEIICTDVIKNSCHQAERFGGKYISFCPVGLVHFATPSVVGGGVLLISREEFFEEEILAKYKLSYESEHKIWEYLQSIPFLAPQRVSYLAELLTILTTSKDQTEKNKLIEKKQSTLSELIYEAKQSGEEKSYPYNKENQLMMAITSGNMNDAQELLNEICTHIFISTGGNLELIKARSLELVVLLSRSAISGGADNSKIFEMNFNYINKITHFDNAEELIFWLWDIAINYVDSVLNLGDIKHKDIIYKAVTYINNNYSEKITLEQVASNIFLSPTYFSKIFKQELGLSFSNYLNRVRIEKAKSLLLHESIPIVDISDIVGFVDQAYFSKVFKKLVGVTPSEYRENKK
jgi:YesN/AraC family two-component response regulator